MEIGLLRHIFVNDVNDITVQCFLESINAVSQSTSRYEDAHVAAFASFELGMLKAQSAQNATVSFAILWT